MYIELIDLDNHATLINVESIIRLNKVIFNDKPTSLISLQGQQGYDIHVNGHQTYDILNAMLIMQGDVVKIQDIADRQEQLDKLLSFHATEDGKHKFIKLLDNADKFVDILSKQISKAKSGQADQAEFDFDTLTADNIN